MKFESKTVEVFKNLQEYTFKEIVFHFCRNHKELANFQTLFIESKSIGRDLKNNNKSNVRRIFEIGERLFQIDILHSIKSNFSLII